MVNSFPSFKWRGKSSKDSCFSSTTPVSISFSRNIFKIIKKLLKKYHSIFGRNKMTLALLQSQCSEIGKICLWEIECLHDYTSKVKTKVYWRKKPLLNNYILKIIHLWRKYCVMVISFWSYSTYLHALIWIFPPFQTSCPCCRETKWWPLASRPLDNPQFHHLRYFEKTMRLYLKWGI